MEIRRSESCFQYPACKSLHVKHRTLCRFDGTNNISHLQRKTLVSVANMKYVYIPPTGTVYQEGGQTSGLWPLQSLLQPRQMSHSAPYRTTGPGGSVGRDPQIQRPEVQTPPRAEEKKCESYYRLDKCVWKFESTGEWTVAYEERANRIDRYFNLMLFRVKTLC